MGSKGQDRPRRRSMRYQQRENETPINSQNSQAIEAASRKARDVRGRDVEDSRNSRIKESCRRKNADLGDSNSAHEAERIQKKTNRFAAGEICTDAEWQNIHELHRNSSIEPLGGKGQESSLPVVIQCAACRSIIADTTVGFLQTNTSTGTISFASVRCVELSKEVLNDMTGSHSNCTFHKAFCKQCRQLIGRKFVSTTTEFDDIRGAFTLDKKCVLTYRIGSSEPGIQNAQVVNPVTQDSSLAAMRSLQSELSTVVESVNSIAEWMQAMESEGSQFRHNFLSWEERVQRLERLMEQLLSIGLSKDLQSDGENNIQEENTGTTQAR